MIMLNPKQYDKDNDGDKKSKRTKVNDKTKKFLDLDKSTIKGSD